MSKLLIFLFNLTAITGHREPLTFNTVHFKRPNDIAGHCEPSTDVKRHCESPLLLATELFWLQGYRHKVQFPPLTSTALQQHLELAIMLPEMKNSGPNLFNSWIYIVDSSGEIISLTPYPVVFRPVYGSWRGAAYFRRRIPMTLMPISIYIWVVVRILFLLQNRRIVLYLHWSARVLEGPRDEI